MRDDFQRVKNALEKAKTEILQLLESEQPLDLASYTTVNASGILSSVITSLVHGDCDLALPLSPENSYLSSVFTTSAFGDSDSTIRLDIGAIYQEYCSRLVSLYLFKVTYNTTTRTVSTNHISRDWWSESILHGTSSMTWT